MHRSAVIWGYLTFVLLAAGPAGARTEEVGWPQFRGPTGQGLAVASGLPTQWSESKNVTWKVAVPGRGWSSPLVLADQIWLTTAVEDGHSLRAICLRLSDGRTVHDVEVFRPEQPVAINAKNSHASPTGVLEPGRLYVHYGAMGTACILTDSGKITWTSRELQLDHKEGPGSSPVLYGNLLIVNCDGMDTQYVAALDKRTGKLAWKTPRSGELDPNTDFRKAYATPLVIQTGNRDELISPGADQLIAYNPVNGQELWKVRYKGFSNVPRPLFGHGQIFFCTGYMQPQLWSVRPGGKGDVTSSHVGWQVTEQVPAIPSPILVGDELYLVSNQGVASCLDAHTGKLHWRHRLGGNFCASPVLADGRLYFANEEGRTFVLLPGKEYQQLETNELESGCLASPAVVGRALLLRTQTHLYRLEDTSPSARRTSP